MTEKQWSTLLHGHEPIVSPVRRIAKGTAIVTGKIVDDGSEPVSAWRLGWYSYVVLPSGAIEGMQRAPHGCLTPKSAQWAG